MKLIFDEQTSIEINRRPDVAGLKPIIEVSFVSSTIVHLTPQELDIFISSLQIVRGGIR